MEYETVKEALKSLIEFNSKGPVTIDGHLATVEEMQELSLEHAFNIADLLGMPELYLDD